MSWRRTKSLLQTRTTTLHQHIEFFGKFISGKSGFGKGVIFLLIVAKRESPLPARKRGNLILCSPSSQPNKNGTTGNQCEQPQTNVVIIACLGHLIKNDRRIRINRRRSSWICRAKSLLNLSEDRWEWRNIVDISRFYKR